MRVGRRVARTLILLLLAGFGEAFGQESGAPRPGSRPAAGVPAGVRPVLLRDVAFEQRLNERVPVDLVFRDEAGRAVTLGRYFRGRPVVLALVYYECPMLCTQVLNGLANALDVLTFDAGREFEVVTVSFDPGESPALALAKKTAYLARYRRPGATDGFHFLTGDQASIDRLTRSVGFRYTYDAARDQYAHASGLMVLTPDGALARYFFGVEYSPRDLRLALIEAARYRIGTPVDQLLLYCYHYDPTTGKYGFVAITLIRLGGAATVLALGAFIFWSWRRARWASAADGANRASG